VPIIVFIIIIVTYLLFHKEAWGREPILPAGHSVVLVMLILVHYAMDKVHACNDLSCDTPSLEP
jgi:hypothetical protein